MFFIATHKNEGEKRQRTCEKNLLSIQTNKYDVISSNNIFTNHFYLTSMHAHVYCSSKSALFIINSNKIILTKNTLECHSVNRLSEIFNIHVYNWNKVWQWLLFFFIYSKSWIHYIKECSYFGIIPKNTSQTSSCKAFRKFSEKHFFPYFFLALYADLPIV